MPTKKIKRIEPPADWLPPLTGPQAKVLRAFRNAERYTDGGGPAMTRAEILKRSKGANPRGLTEVLHRLEWHKCIRFYPSFGAGEVTWALTALGRRVLEAQGKKG